MRAGVQRLANVILVTAMGGCATSGPPPVPPPPTAPLVSFDGNYRGSIRLTSSGVPRGQTNWCDTPPAISLSLQNNAFSYVLAHPNVPKDSTYSLSPTFAVAVAPDGSFNATSQNGEAQMVGRITGSPGWPDQWDGLRLCIYGRKILSDRAVRGRIGSACRDYPLAGLKLRTRFAWCDPAMTLIESPWRPAGGLRA
jgi:hypothetical protein